MEGDLGDDEGRGLVPRAAAAVVGALHAGDYVDYSVTVSYLEIYNEELSDLLAPPHAAQKLDLKDVGNGRGVICFGLSEVPVTSVHDILVLVQRAQERRRVAETGVNARSSRSHSIFTMKVRCRKLVGSGELENVGKLHLVDLAGSECAKKVGPSPEECAAPCPAAGRPGTLALNDEDRERERRSINQSLLTLGRVISALREGTGRVPYRDSKLTRLLQDALGGRCKTVIIATVSPAIGAVEETISTLTYAEQAAGIRNKPVASSLLRTIRLASAGDCRVDCNGLGASDFAELELRVAYLAQEVEEAQAALARQYREATEQSERAVAAEERASILESELMREKLLAEEHSFARARLAEFSDKQADVAECLHSALVAAVHHGQDLTDRLLDRCTVLAAGRKQAREACKSAEVCAQALAEACRLRAKEISQSVGLVHEAHCTATGVAAGITKEHQKILGDLRAGIKERHVQISQFLDGTVTDATEASTKQEERQLDHCKRIDSMAGVVNESLGRLQVHLTRTSAENTAELGRRATHILEGLETSKQALQDSCSAASTELADVRVAATATLEACLKKYHQEVSLPSSELLAELQGSERHATGLKTAVMSLRAAESEEGKKSASRWSNLTTSQLAAFQEHQQSSEVCAAKMSGALQDLQSGLDAGCDATRSLLEQFRQKLLEGRALLRETMEREEAEVQDVAAAMQWKLQEAWGQQRIGIQALDASLQEAVEEQETSNVSSQVQDKLKVLGDKLRSSVSQALVQLLAAKEALELEVQKLQAQRQNEAKTLQTLTTQRENLAAEIAQLQKSLLEVQGQLGAGQEKLERLKLVQENGREEAFKRIATLVRTELDSLGTEHAKGVAALTADLDVAKQRLAAASESAGTSLEESTRRVLSAEETVKAWSKDIGERCDALLEAGMVVGQGAAEVKAAAATADDELLELRSTIQRWGEGCDRVVEHVGTGRNLAAELTIGLQRLQPEWLQLHDRLLKAAKEGGEGSRGAEKLLRDSSRTGEEATGHLELLHSELTQHRDTCSESAAHWSNEAAKHVTSFKGLKDLVQVGQAEVEAAVRRRAEALAAHEQRSTEHLQGVISTRVAAVDLEQTVLAHYRQLPENHQPIDTAFADSFLAFEELSSQAACFLAPISHSVDELQSSASAAAGALKEHLLLETSVLAELSEEIASTSESASAFCVEAAQQDRAKWQQAQATVLSHLENLESTATAAEKDFQSTTSAGSERILAELARGEGAKAASAAALEALAVTNADALKEQQAALESSLAAAPLAFKTEASDPVPTWPEAAKQPQISLQRRPADDSLTAEFKRSCCFEPGHRVKAEPHQAVENLCVEANIKIAKHSENGIIKKGTAAAPRVVLAELNR